MAEAIEVGDHRLPLSAWIPGSAAPAREGVYRRRGAEADYACWSGKHWYADAASPQAAATRVRLSPHQSLEWRGVAVPTPGPCFACRGHTVIDYGFDPEANADLIGECEEC